jgi:glutamate N-acetyltransferase/amino-acid N-acetyltransferase
MSVDSSPRAVRGFRFAGVTAGLKPSGAPDLALIAADSAVAAAGVFTTNRVTAAPVVITRRHLRGGRLRAIVANSGSANCFTGKAGLRLALDSCLAVAEEIGCRPDAVAPCSTGVIGHLYDLAKYRAGVKAAAASLAPKGLGDFARAIMTTDTMPKIASTSVRIGGAEVTVAGAAKGSGMMEPKMATMLAFIVSDAVASPAMLKVALGESVPHSFNAITVDGDMSTNDTLLVLASGAAANRALAGRELAKFYDAIGEVAYALARGLVYDAEGATKLVRVEVRGARSGADAVRIARRIGNSPLVKTAFFGCDPNVGRILMAAGGAGAALQADRLELHLGGVKVAARGALLADALERARAEMRKREFTVRLDLRLGKGAAAILTSDLSYDYVRINAEYTT